MLAFVFKYVKTFNQRYILHNVTFMCHLYTFWSLVRVYSVVQKSKVTFVNYVTILWITSSSSSTSEFRKSCIENCIKNIKNTLFNIHSCKTFQTLTNFYSLKKSLISRGLILGKYPRNGDCIKLNPVPDTSLYNNHRCVRYI